MRRPVLTLVCALVPLLLCAQPADTNIQLSLQQQFGRALFKECRLELAVYEAAGSASVRCLRNVTPTSEVLAERKLTRDEIARLAALVPASNLLSGGHIGTDTTFRDGMFETLKVTGTKGTGVLVTSGNPSFTQGPRRTLLDLLHGLLEELHKRAK